VDSRNGWPRMLHVYITSFPLTQEPGSVAYSSADARLQVGSQQSSMVVVVLFTRSPRLLSSATLGIMPVRAVRPAGQGTTWYVMGLFQWRSCSNAYMQLSTAFCVT